MLLEHAPPGFQAKTSIACVLVLVENEILLIQHGPTKSSAGLWGCPGGKCEAGESAEEAAIREALEEIRLQLTADELQLLPPHIKRFAVRYKSGFSFWYTCFLVRRAVKPMLVLDPREVAQATWFTMEQALRLAPIEENDTFLRQIAPYLHP